MNGPHISIASARILHFASMLNAYWAPPRKQDDFLREPALITHANLLEPSPVDSWLGRRLGPYRLIEEIGQGGMGAVYRAVRADDQYQKQVAIKLVRTGFETRFAQARFRSERQILATLEHPNIARLLDGGTADDGSPYFVMELVEGIPIHQYCDAHKLSIPERLRLFRTVCCAIQYAHQSLVVHRDLKPANILVTSAGVPKLLDFGIAKILDANAFAGEVEPTIDFLRMLTPEYASPEQVRGEAISTASDVYSLGVVLYLLLTGHRPYQVDGLSTEAMRQAVCESEPARLARCAPPKGLPPCRRIGTRAAMRRRLPGLGSASRIFPPDRAASPAGRRRAGHP